MMKNQNSGNIFVSLLKVIKAVLTACLASTNHGRVDTKYAHACTPQGNLLHYCPVCAFWLFSFERYINGILGNQTKKFLRHS